MKLLGRMQNLANAGQRQMDLVGITLCAVLTLGGYLVIARPIFDSRDDRVLREASIIQSRDQVTRLLADTRSMRARLTTAQQLLGRIEIPLRESHAVNQRLAELSALASECGLEVQQMLPGTLVNSQRFSQLPLQVSGTGNYRACATFMHKLREKFPDTGVRGFDLSRAQNDSAADVSFIFELQWFVQH